MYRCFQRVSTSYVVAIGATSTASSAAVGPGISHVRLAATSDCWVKIGDTPVADKTTSFFLPAKSSETFRINANEKVAVIQDSAAGSLSVSEMTQ